MTTIDIAILSYNEAKSLPTVVEGVTAALANDPTIGCRLLIINNGSQDETPAVIHDLEGRYTHVRHIDIPVNRGYGYGVAQGLGALSGDIIGYMWGDNQFDPAIVRDLVHELMAKPALDMVKTYRAKRYDGRLRLVVSTLYQLLFRMLYGFYTIDINSGPKLFRSTFLTRLLPLRSTDWFIDAEIMIKASRCMTRDRIVELPIIFYPRKFGRSNVRAKDCWHFLRKLVKYKFVSF